MSQATQQHITARIDRAKATNHHLLDVKLAGHSPRKTELQIGHDPVLAAIEAHRLSFEAFTAAADHEMDFVRAHGEHPSDPAHQRALAAASEREQSTGFETDRLWRVLLATRPTTVEGLHEFARYALAETRGDTFSDVPLEALQAIEAGLAALTGRVIQ